MRTEMANIGRRSFLRGLSLGAAAPLLGATCRDLVREARGQPSVRRRFVLLTDANGWGHQGLSRDPSDPKEGLLGVVPRAETDWDLPAVLQPLAKHRGKMNLVFSLYNPHGRNLHGNSAAALSVMPLKDDVYGGISIDRFIGASVGAQDAFSSLVFAVARDYGRPDSGQHQSYDGPGRKAPAYTTPLRAYVGVFGPQAVESPAQAERLLLQDRSLLDGVCADSTRLMAGLAGPERQKVEQLLDSCRTLERRLTARQQVLGSGRLPPPPTVDDSGLRRESIRGLVDVAAEALRFGLTRVVHVAIAGADTHNMGWGFLGLPFDAHLGLGHGTVGERADLGFVGPDRHTRAYKTIIGYKAGELAYLLDRLAALPEADGTALDNTLALWMNTGGGKHHNGNDTHAAVLIGDLKGRLRTRQYLRTHGTRFRFGRRCIGDLFLTAARAMGVETETFGDPAHGKGVVEALAV